MGRISHLLTRSLGRPPERQQVFHASSGHRAQSWTKPRRVVTGVEWHRAERCTPFPHPAIGFPGSLPTAPTTVDRGGGHDINGYWLGTARCSGRSSMGHMTWT